MDGRPSPSWWDWRVGALVAGTAVTTVVVVRWPDVVPLGVVYAFVVIAAWFATAKQAAVVGAAAVVLASAAGIVTGQFTTPGYWLRQFVWIGGALTVVAIARQRDVRSARLLGLARAAEASEAQYRMLAEHASDVVGQTDPDGRFIWVSESIERVLGWQPDQVVGTSLDLVHPEDVERATEIGRKARGETEQGELRIRTGTGDYRWMAVASRPLPTAGAGSRIVTLRDIAEEVAARDELQHVLGHDPVTGLALRPVMQARLAAHLDPRSSGPGSVGVFCIAVDSLGTVVDALGYSAAERVITGIATRLITAVEDPDRVGRGPGNEFIVFMTGLASRADSAEWADDVQNAVAGPLVAEGQRLEPSVSIGIAVASPGDDAGAVLRDASLALRQAKAQGRGGRYFADPDIAVAARKRLALELEMRSGLERDEFAAWFQPIVDIETAAVCGYETLIRWVKPDGSVASPDAFLPVAQSTGLVQQLDLRMLELAIATLGSLPTDITIAVNADATTLAREDYAPRVLELLEAHHVEPPRLHLEVTESTLITLTDPLKSTIDRVTAAGVRLYVDDFGTGYSSISHLRDLPVAGMKLDRSFTSGDAAHSVSQRLAAGLAALASTLNLDTIAEGVETREQASLLRDQGWRRAQGWLYGPASATPQRDVASTPDS